MTTVVIAPYNVANFPEGGGHFWVYMQYVQGFRQQGCDVYWLEEFVSSGDAARDARALECFTERLDAFGLGGKTLLYSRDKSRSGANAEPGFIGVSPAAAQAVFDRADLLLNFYYAMDQSLLARFRRTALVDIDPGLLQFWITRGQIEVSRHDYYCTTGEHIQPTAVPASEQRLSWIPIRPPVCLESWPYSYTPEARAYTTISSWWGGGGKGEFITDGAGIFYENNKRVTFLQYVDLPQRTSQTLELALNLGSDEAAHDDDAESAAANFDGVTDYVSDAVDRRKLVKHGWHITNPYAVAASPADYQSYIRNSRGEFSCAKPSYLKFRNAWISDRTLCYLATGKPVIIQDTGPSSYLPSGEGMFRFSTMPQAVDAFAKIEADYEKHCRAAREIAEAHFDARHVAAAILSGCEL